MESAIKKILVTGSSGFVGGRFIRDYGDQYDIVTINLRTTKPEEFDFSGIEAIVHCAALVHQMKGAPEEEYFKVNRDLTLALANAAKAAGVKHFIFLSTAHVFGDSGTLDHTQKLKPTDPCHPLDGYGKSKLAAEKGLLALEEKFFRVTILRPPMVYGEGARGNLIKLAKLINSMPLAPFGYSRNQRSLIYVGNLIHVIHRVIEEKITGILLPQDEKPLSIKEMSQLIAKTYNKKCFFVPVPHQVLRLLSPFLNKMITRLYGTLLLDPNELKKITSKPLPYTTEEGFKRMLVESKT